MLGQSSVPRHRTVQIQPRNPKQRHLLWSFGVLASGFAWRFMGNSNYSWASNPTYNPPKRPYRGYPNDK